MAEYDNRTLPEVWGLYQSAKKRAEEREKVCKERFDIIAGLRIEVDDLTKQTRWDQSELEKKDRTIQSLTMVIYDLVMDDV